MDESVVKNFEQELERVVPKFSEAIRKGVKMSGPAYGAFVDQNGNTCVQGAALLAVGRLDRVQQWNNFDTLRSLWPGDEKLRGEAAKMNNCRILTREQLADWFEAKGK